MSFITIKDRLLKQVLREDRFYKFDEIKARFPEYSPEYVKQALRFLVKWDMIESAPPDKFARNKQYKNRQRSLI